MTRLNGVVVAVSASAGHGFSKTARAGITLLAGLGVEGDAHCGVKMQHRSRVAQNPERPNLRQVHLLGEELLTELAAGGFDIAPGGLGENILTRALDLLGMPAGARLHIGDSAVVEVTGLRNPCRQIDRYRAGLLSQVLGRTPDGRLIRKAGIMGVVICGGIVRVHDPVRVVLPSLPHRRLERV